MKSGVIGLGQMGRGIAANLHRAGFLAAAWDVNAAARAALPDDVARLPPAQMADGVDAIIFVVPSSVEIEACLEGILAVDRPGQILIDLTTSAPAETVRLAGHAAAAGRAYLDAGMSGGATGADTGRLTLMFGGDPTSLALVRPLLDAIATRIFHVGPAGAGHTMKLVHNMVCHTNFLALTEACRIAERAGLALPAVIDVINAGNARSYISEARFPNHILSGTFDGRSRVANLAKDLGMAEDLAVHLGQSAHYTTLTTALLQAALEEGLGEADFTTLYQCYGALAR